MGSQFMQNFMQGWQMGQGRNENQRRNQELEMERQRQEQMMAQRAEEFALQKEEFAVRKKQLAAQEAQHQFDAKREAAALMSRNQQTLPPETQDLGGGTTLNLGAATQPRAPITAAIPGAPEGTPEVPMPFQEDIEDQKRQEIAMALEKLGAATNLTESIKSQYRQPARPVSVSPGGTLVDPESGKVVFKAPEKPAAPREPGALDSKGESNFRAVTTKFQSDKAIENANNSRVAKELADQVIANPGSAPNQLMTVYSLIKNLDQGSAVREGETALVQSTLSYVAQYQNAFDKLTRNQLIPPETAKEFAEATKRLAEQWIKVGDKKTKQYRAQAKGLRIGEAFDMYLNESGITGGESGAAPQATHKWSPQGGLIPIGGK